MSKLNPEQNAAVEHFQGPLLVLAGAGSGKTRVITQRIKRLIERGVRPEAILAVSFTNKAAAEMKERMEPLVGHEMVEKLWLSTFHSFGVRFLGEEAHAMGHNRFVIFDQGDTMGLVKDLMRRTRKGERTMDSGAILSRISLWKNAFLAPEEIPESNNEYDLVARDLYPLYEAQLRSMHAVDFDDLVVAPVRILRDREDIREKWQQRFSHMMIDEFQDTNRSQLELVRLLANQLHNVCVVGDDDQSIYGWRGADVGNILDFDKFFPGAQVVKLEQNYRSRAQILYVANAAIGKSKQKGRHTKELKSARGLGENVRMCVFADPGEEAVFVAKETVETAKKELRPWSDYAVLYRSNLQAKLIEEELRAHGVPYRVFGGTQFFDRKEVKDAASYLRFVVNPRDELALRRIINYPPRGVGTATVERLTKFGVARGFGLTGALRAVETVPDLPPAAARALTLFNHSINEFRARFETGESLAKNARELFDEVGIKHDLLYDEGGKVGQKRWENVESLIRTIERFENSERGKKTSMDNFLQRIAVRNDEKNEEEDEANNQVVLSTLHGSKGLEFPVVYFIGCVEGYLPHTRTTDPKATEAAPTDVEEERRLFYVGITRAQDRLYMSRSDRRMVRGKNVKVAPSRFLEGLPEEYIDEYTRSESVEMGVSEIADMAASIIAQLTGDG